MMYNLITRTIFVEWVALLGLVPLGAENCSAQTKAAERMTYGERVITISKGFGQIISEGALVLYPPFIELGSEGKTNIDNCIQFLAERGHSDDERRIAILSMYKLNLTDRIDFLHKIASLIDRGLVSSEEVSTAVQNTPDFSTLIVENYADDAVQRVLKEITSRPGLKPTTGRISSLFCPAKCCAI